MARFRRTAPISTVLRFVGVFRGWLSAGSRLKTGADKSGGVLASVNRAEFFALPVCSFDQPLLPFVHSPGLGDHTSHERAVPFEDDDEY